MKAKLWSMILGAFTASAGALCAEDPKLEVHEWGTFTVLSGSDGTALQWYQPGQDLDLLPEFVTGGIGPFQKGANIPSMVRMETPVLYFYPEKEMPVKVEVAFNSGRITEWFPAPGPPENGRTVWSGKLFPPDHADALKRIPEVKSRGDHYRHAREVPAAWIFQGRASIFENPVPPVDVNKDSDKFIFYRGAGDALPPYATRVDDKGVFTMRHTMDGDAIEVAFALSVDGNQARWARLPKLPATNREDTATFSAFSQVALGKPSEAVDKVAIELSTAIVEELDRAGLTPEEARAMVATWQGHWFREPGTRILAILPRKYVDEVLPLTITPKPQKVERVFVARFETLAPAKEEALLGLLNRDLTVKPDAREIAAFAKLQLGRFGSGALTRVQSLESSRLLSRYWELRRLELATEGSATAAR
jgi:hypothetical protein